MRAQRNTRYRLACRDKLGYSGSYLGVSGESTAVEFAPHPRVTCVDVKHSTRPGDELNLKVKLIRDSLRQTGGSRAVVSFRAVFNAYFHRLLHPSV